MPTRRPCSTRRARSSRSATALAASTANPDAAAAEAAPPPPAAPRPASAARAGKGQYPRFLREGDALVKIGWSRSQGAEYEHKCPKRVVDVLIGGLTRVAGPGKRFVMETLLPLRDPDGGADLPAYQAYVALAFLRHHGLVAQHGRSGYSIPKSKSLPADAAAAWAGLTAR